MKSVCSFIGMTRVAGTAHSANHPPHEKQADPTLMQTVGEWAVNQGRAASLPVLKVHIFAAVRPRPGWAGVPATCLDRLPGAALIHPQTRAARQKLPSKRTIPFFWTSLLRLVVEPVLEHPTIRTAAKTNEAERNNFMFDHLLSKPSGYNLSFRARHVGGNAESRIVTKNISLAPTRHAPRHLAPLQK
jgi:hypothetical protein